MATLAVCEFELFSLNLGEEASESYQVTSDTDQISTIGNRDSEFATDNSSKELAAYVKSIRELALKCDEKLKVAIATAEENALLRAQVTDLKLKVASLQKDSSSRRRSLMWTDLLSQAGKLQRKDRVLLVQSIAGQLGMIAQFPRNQTK